jgi:uncharacterized protein
MNEHSSLESWRESPRGAANPRDDSSTQEPQMPSFPRSVDEDYSETIALRSRSPLRFFLLVFALSIPFALIGEVTRLQLYPGVPVSALGFVCPATAAAILAYREKGTAAVTKLLRRSFDYKRIGAKVWYVPIVLLIPGITILAYGLMRMMGLPLPTPLLSVPTLLVMLLVFFIMALGEELGWTGYAIDPMQDRWNALQASILLGLVWAGWHIIAIVQAGQSPAYIVWTCLYMVGLRVLLVWLYNNTGKSIFAIALCHTIINVVTWSLVPGNSYELQLIMTLIVAVGVATVTVVWGPRTLAR